MSAPTQGPDRRLPDPGSHPTDLDQADQHSDHETQMPSERVALRGHSHRHRLMMLVCCIPMIIIAALLVMTGVAGSGALLWALGCLVMMAMMMLMMPGGHTHK